MQIIKIKPEQIRSIQPKVARVLQEGGLVVFPSDTVYGFLADAQNKKAVEKLIRVKRRPFGKPISVFLPGFESLQDYVQVGKSQYHILKKLLPGPFTIVLPSKHKVVSLLESEKGTLGIRIPDYAPVQELAKEFGRAFTATSANISGKGPHYTIDSFLKTLSGRKRDEIDLVVDVGRLPFNKPSTVVDLTKSEILILRKGDLVLRDEDVFLSEAPVQTRKIAKFLVKKYLSYARKQGVFFFLEGELGVGKTEFVKGLGEFLGIKDIISPTFVGFYEYEIRDYPDLERFVHFDLYNIEDEKEFEYFRIQDFAKKGVIVAIEWGERIAGVIDELKRKVKIVYIRFSYEDEKKRRIKIFQVDER